MEEKKTLDWLAIEADYRPNKLSLREIGKKHGCTEGAIRRKAKAEGWERDLSAKIKSQADAIVIRETVRTEYAANTEKEIVDANAHHSATIQITERKDVTKARNVAMSLLVELESQVTDKELYENLGELMRTADEKGMDKLNEIYHKVISFGGRTDSMKKLSDTLKTLIDLERRVYKIDEESDPTDKKVNVRVSFVE